jgi:hypothetical protein
VASHSAQIGAPSAQERRQKVEPSLYLAPFDWVIFHTTCQKQGFLGFDLLPTRYEHGGYVIKGNVPREGERLVRIPMVQLAVSTVTDVQIEGNLSRLSVYLLYSDSGVYILTASPDWHVSAVVLPAHSASWSHRQASEQGPPRGSRTRHGRGLRFEPHGNTIIFSSLPTSASCRFEFNAILPLDDALGQG